MTEINSLESDQSANSLLNTADGDQNLGIRSWRQDTVVLIQTAIMALCGLGLLVLLAVPLLAALQSVLGISLPWVTNLVQWLGSGSKGLILAIALAVIALIAFLILRFRLLNNPLLYTSAGCPQCQEDELIRVRRRRWDRMIAYLGIPVRRYVCRNCSWDGLRIGGPLPNAESNLESVPADLLLANDLGTQQSETPISENG